MNLKKLSIIGAVFTALLSTLCCLPAFLFLFLGVSSAYFSTLSSLGFIRIPMAIVSIALLFFAFYKKSPLKCECVDKKEKKRKIFLAFSISIIILFLLFYPEIIPFFMD
ncbi:MAG: hypothetical protein ACNI25_11250 [Halarcobacter sp.]